MSQKKQEALSSWFQDLAGNKSLQALSRSKVSLSTTRSAHLMHCTVCVCVCVRACVRSLLNCGTPPSLPSAQIPLLMKKEEIFDLLCEHSVPMSRATWFIKVRGGSCALW